MHIGQESIVDLHVKTGINDGPVFLVQGFGEREQVGLLVLVVLDLGTGQRTCRRHYRQEAGKSGVLLLGNGEASREVLDVAADLALARVGNWLVNNNAIAEPLAQARRGIVLGIEFGKRSAVLAAGHRRHRVLELPWRCRPYGDALEAFENVERPVQSLAELAVADNVDADVGLLAHNLQ